MKKVKIIWFCLGFIITGLLWAAPSKQLLGPTASTTANALARWTDTTASRLTNSVVFVDINGNLSGVNTQNLNQANISTGITTNGLIFLSRSSLPSASDVGGTIGSITNYLMTVTNGITTVFWSDGTTLYSKQIAP